MEGEANVSLAQSRITSQGQISIPVSIMRQFGLAPGSVVTWDVLEGRLVLDKTGTYSLEEIRAALKLPKGLHKSDEEIRAGLQARTRAKHASR